MCFVYINDGTIQLAKSERVRVRDKRTNVRPKFALNWQNFLQNLQIRCAQCGQTLWASDPTKRAQLGGTDGGCCCGGNLIYTVSLQAIEQSKRYDSLSLQCRNVSGPHDLSSFLRYLQPESPPKVPRKAYAPPQPAAGDFDEQSQYSVSIRITDVKTAVYLLIDLIRLSGGRTGPISNTT